MGSENDGYPCYELELLVIDNIAWVVEDTHCDGYSTWSSRYQVELVTGSEYSLSPLDGPTICSTEWEPMHAAVSGDALTVGGFGDDDHCSGQPEWTFSRYFGDETFSTCEEYEAWCEDYW